MLKFLSHLPRRTMVYIVVVWIMFLILNGLLKKIGIFNSIPVLFPITVFNGPAIHFSGIPYLILFLIILGFAVRLAPKLSLLHVYVIILLLIILGNLGQGNWDYAFGTPFYEGSMQYYHDAIKITSWSEWLGSFNSNQRTFLTHSQTHPPFAVLVHYLVLNMSANSITILSLVFVLISSLSVILIWQIFKMMGVLVVNRNLLALLFSVIPAVNIYSAVSLDSIILTSSTLFLFGTISILISERISMVGLLAIAFGITTTNLLSYGGVFLIGVAGILALWEFKISKKFNVTFSILVSIGLFLLVSIMLYSLYGYNHIQGFLTASALENPNGFQGFYEPLKYLATRVAGISELAFFLSFGFLAIMFHPKKLGISYFDWQSMDIGIFLSGVIILLAMLLSGAFRTGELARPALFIYPYIIITLRNADSIVLIDILKAAGIQTVAMQLLGGYFW